MHGRGLNGLLAMLCASSSVNAPRVEAILSSSFEANTEMFALLW